MAVSTLALAAMLTTYDQLRSLSATLLASAGIAGLEIGIAARPLVSDVLAGLQIFLAEPLRIDDVLLFLQRTAPSGLPRRWVKRAEIRVDPFAPNH